MILVSTIDYAAAVAAGLLALTVAFYERRSVSYWRFVAGMLGLSLESVCCGLAADALPAGRAFWQDCRLGALALLPGTWLGFSLSYARGNFREFLSRWRWLLGALSLGPLALVLFFSRGLLVSDGSAQLDYQAQPLTSPGIALQLLFLLSVVLVLMNLERTFRAAVGTMRWRIKFVLLGLGVLFAVRAYSACQCLLFRAVSLGLETLNSVALLLGCLLVFRGLFRAGHFEVNVYPSHAVLRHSLTLLLAGVYLLLVGVFAKAVTLFGGADAFPLKAFLVLVSLILLALLLLSDRTQSQLKRFVSRNFQRPLYNYRTIWHTFTAGTARHVLPADLSRAVVRLVSELFQALSVNLWILDDQNQKLMLAGSSSLSESKGRLLSLDAEETAQVLAALEAQTAPLDLDACREPWAALLRRLQPVEFPSGGNRLCVPMRAGGELLGLLVLGDRVGAVPFSAQDFDLLECVADQAAGSLLNVRLSQKLLQAKELEAFQVMSSFFVHDLKNTASTLSLMLQNLPVRFDDPRFREDALRGIGKTVSHINDLIRSLSLLRQELVIQPVDADFNALVAEALTCLEPIPQLQLSKEFRPLSQVRVDPVQIQNVITNLLLNARDAVNARGRIRVETSQLNGWVTLQVADDGCGMTPEFVERSLFRPFQTTKKQGIGIGMFQSRMIVEAHRGKIHVQTEPDKGTTFRVLLPVAPNL